MIIGSPPLVVVLQVLVLLAFLLLLQIPLVASLSSKLQPPSATASSTSLEHNDDDYRKDDNDNHNVNHIHHHYPNDDSNVLRQHNDQNINNSKQRQICSVSGALDVVRLSSSTTRLAFRGALDDVEFIRNYVGEAALNTNRQYQEWLQRYEGQALDNVGLVIGSKLDELSQTLDVIGRNLTNTTPMTTVQAGMGYVDDRPDRRIERYVGLVNQPLVGTKQTDLSLVESTANIFPTLVERTSSMAANHQGILSMTIVDDNAKNVSSATTSSPSQQSKQEPLYVAAWIGTLGEAWTYYPPLHQTAGRPFNFGEVLGADYNSKGEEFVKPNLPPAVISKPYFTAPYPDTAIPGLSLITAQAAVYYQGDFMGYHYPPQTYIASTGVDISVASMSSTVLEELDGTLTKGSFAMVVGATDLHIVLISQSTVQKIYPPRTGMEESRVVYDAKNSSVIVRDGRNQPYQVSDTIFQPPTNLTNAHWTLLRDNIQKLRPGQRSYMELDIRLTGDESPTLFYVMYERWPDVADWAELLFVPKQELNMAVHVEIQPYNRTPDNIDNNHQSYNNTDGDHDPNALHVIVDAGTTVERQTVIHNAGTLDVTVSIDKLPSWMTHIPVDLEKEHNKNGHRIPAGQSMSFSWLVSTENVNSVASSLIAFTVKDDGYDDCFYEQVLTTNVYLTVIYPEELNQLDRIRPYGFILSTITVFSAIGWSVWVFLHSNHRVVRASQPIFLHMMCAGIGVMGFSIVPLSIDDSLATNHGCNVACMAFPWLLAMGFSISFSALFSKIWRINQIVAACKNYKRVYVSTRDVMIPFFVICTLNVTILGVWTAVDPLTWVRNSTGQNGEDASSYGHCSLRDSIVSVVCMALLLLVNFAALVLALIQLYRARELSTEYSEGKYIAIAVASMMQAFLTGLPILMIVTDSPQASYFIKSTIVFVVAMSLLLLTFVPKFYIAGAKQQSSTEGRSTDVHPRDKSSAGSVKTMSLAPAFSVAVPAIPEGESIVFEDSSIKEQHLDSSNDDVDTLLQLYRQPQSIAYNKQPTIRHPRRNNCRNSRPQIISDLSQSMTCSEYEQLERMTEELPKRFSDKSAQSAPPTMPTRHPTVVLEDTTDKSDDERLQESFPKIKVLQVNLLDDIDEHSKSSSTPPRKPLRAPTEVEVAEHGSENATEEMFQDEEDCRAVVVATGQISMNHSNATYPRREPSLCEDDKPEAPPRKRERQHSNATQPMRVPSTAEEFCV